MSLLIFSPKCKHSVEVINFIKKHKQLQQIVQYHNKWNSPRISGKDNTSPNHAY